MTDISPEDRELIDRYLASRLTGPEVLMVETRIVEDPGFRNEVELTEALREGLQELQRRGEIAPLLTPRRTLLRQPRFALAASLGVLALGAASFLFFQLPGDDPAGVTATTLRFEQTRSADAAPHVVWQRPGGTAVLRLHFDVGLEPAAAYRIVIERASGAGGTVLNAVAGLTEDGVAVLTVDSAALAAGDYRIVLTPQSPAPSPEPVVYALRISDQA